MNGIISSTESLVGEIVDNLNLSGTLSSNDGLSGILSNTVQDIHENYIGEYVITPSITSDKILNTKNKALSSDLTVKKVPYFETSNSEGTTVYIGSEV